MLVSISRGTCLSPSDLFALSFQKLTRLVTGGSDHSRFAKAAQYRQQAWSLVEHLAGPTATRDRREQFRAFVKDRRARRGGERGFESHFGFNYERLNQNWRDWVLAGGIGRHEPPPADVQEALAGRLIPMILDPQARIMDRIEAIRSMGSTGYAFGAGA